VETASEIHFGKNARSSHVVDAFVEARDGVDNFLCELVQAAIVDAHTESSVVLFREKNTGSESRAAGSIQPLARYSSSCFLSSLSSGGLIRKSGGWEESRAVPVNAGPWREKEVFRGKFDGENIRELLKKAFNRVRNRTLKDGFSSGREGGSSRSGFSMPEGRRQARK